MADTQDLVVDLKIKDNLSVGLANAKKNVEQFGDSATSAAGKAESAFGNAASSIRAKFAGLGGDIQKGLALGLGIGAVQVVSQGVSALTGFLQDSVGAAAEEESQIKRLTAALNENAPTWDRNSAAIEQAIQSRQAFGFSDGELRDSLAGLAAATHDVDQAFKLQSLAMDLARFKGEDLATATDELVKVQAGSFRALKSLGIEISATASSSEALSAIQKVVAGQYVAFADSAEGAMARARISVRNLQEDIGKGLLPTIGKLADAVDHVATVDLPSFGDNSVREINAVQDAWDFLWRDIGSAAPETRIDAAARALREEAGAATLAFIASERHAGAVEREAAALAKAKATIDLHNHSLQETAVGLGGYTTILLGATGQTDKLSDALLRGGNEAITAAVGYGMAADQIDRLKGTSGKPFVAPNLKVPGLDAEGLTGLKPGGLSLQDSFIQTLLLHNQNLATAEERAAAARALALAKAKADASAYADVLSGKLDAALKKEKDTATTLFDTLHARHLQAITDTEKLAEKQHDTALQAISDALKIRLAANAAPVNAAEARQQQIDLSRQRRDLGESLQSAQQSGDPEAIRRASEALQSFNASQRIAALKVEQATKDLAAQTEAAAAQKAADDKLAAAKLAQAAGLEEENKRFKKQTDDFDRALAALKIRDKGASPGKVAKDISDLEGRFGITRDSAGHSHIEDPLVVAIKTIKIPAPNFSPTIIYNPPIFAINGRQLASYIASAQSPSSTPGVRTGAATPKAT